MQTRDSIELLTEIESTIEAHIREIDHMESIDQAEVTKEEKFRKGEYKKKQREINFKEEEEANMKKNNELKARMDRVV